MHVPEIIEVKDHLEKLEKNSMIEAWELPYENLLTRRSAAIFFVTPKKGKQPEIWKELANYDDFSFRENIEKKLSDLEFRITFSTEEKEKNENVNIEGKTKKSSVKGKEKKG